MRALSGSLALFAGLGILTALPSAIAAPTPEHVVYVMTNNAEKNEILYYRENTTNGVGYVGRHFQTGGRGSGGVTDPLGSQHSILLNDDHTLLFAVNAGSGDISVFHVSNNGALDLWGVYPSGGSEPVALAQYGKMLYVLNAGGYGSVAVFHVDADGVLKQRKKATVNLNGDLGGGSSIVVSPDGGTLVVTERGFNNIDTFPIEANGHLGEMVVNHSEAPGVFSATFDSKGILLVSETGAAGVANGSAISSYKVKANGKLSVITQSLPTYGAANCWNAITPDGKHIYVSNAGSSTISGFKIGAKGVLTPIGSTVVGTNPEGSVNLDIAISSDGRFLFSLNSGTGTVSVFYINDDGTLALMITPSAFDANSGANGLATF